MRIGVVGLQHFHAHEMMAGLSEIPGVELVAICEPDDAIWQRQGQPSKLPRYRDYREMVAKERLQAVIMENPRPERATAAAFCLQQGISVLADKPLCMSMSDVSLLRDATKASDAILFLYLTERYNPAVYTLFDLVNKGVLGEIASFTSFRPHKLLKETRPQWFWHRETNGGILLDLLIHDFDIFCKLTKAKVTEVYATHGNLATGEHPDFEDVGHALLKTASGVTGMFRADWLTPAGEKVHGDCRYFVVGDEGWAEVQTTGGFGDDTGESVRIVTNTSGPSTVPLVSPKTTIFQDFVQAIQGATPTLSTHDLLRASELVLLARESADKGIPVKGGVLID